MPRIHVRGLGQPEQVELVAVAFEPGDVVGKPLSRGHPPESEQFVELHAGVELARLDFERHVLNQVLCSSVLGAALGSLLRCRASYRDVLELFFQIHRPDLGEHVMGSMYRSEIFYVTDEQRQVAEDTIADVEAAGFWPKVATEIARPGPSWRPRPKIRTTSSAIRTAPGSRSPGWQLSSHETPA